MKIKLSSEVFWNTPPTAPRLNEQEVHVWRIALNQPQAIVQRLRTALAPDENGRVHRFHFQRDKTHFIVAHGLLRLILSHYIGEEPGQLRFEYSQHGKPFLSRGNADQLRFNLSHSHDLALLAITLDCEIGVDIERIRADIAIKEIAEIFFSPREFSSLRSLPAYLQPEAFFNCWTRKEAYLKARGEGISLPLDKFSVSLIPGESAAMLHHSDNNAESNRWFLQDIKPGKDYVAALAVAARISKLECWQWDCETKDETRGSLSQAPITQSSQTDGFQKSLSALAEDRN